MNSGQKRRAGGAYRRAKQLTAAHAKAGKDRSKERKAKKK